MHPRPWRLHTGNSPINNAVHAVFIIYKAQTWELSNQVSQKLARFWVGITTFFLLGGGAEGCIHNYTWLTMGAECLVDPLFLRSKFSKGLQGWWIPPLSSSSFEKSLENIYLLCIVGVFVCMYNLCATYMQYIRRPEEGTRSSWDWSYRGFGSCFVGAGNWSQIL